MQPDYLDLPSERRIAYCKSDGTGVGVVFLGGFSSDMTGTKAVHLEEACGRSGRPYLRFDYTGHGRSSGEFADGCVGGWARDARETIEMLTEGPQILVGSSMGGWISLLLARHHPEKVAGLVGIAAAPDFMREIESGFDREQRRSMESTGRTELPSEYSDTPLIITRKMLVDGMRQSIFDHPLELSFPVRLLQGTNDEDVDQSVALQLLEHSSGPDIRLTLVKDGDHKLSSPPCLKLIEDSVNEVAGRIGQSL